MTPEVRALLAEIADHAHQKGPENPFPVLAEAVAHVADHANEFKLTDCQPYEQDGDLHAPVFAAVLGWCDAYQPDETVRGSKWMPVRWFHLTPDGVVLCDALVDVLWGLPAPERRAFRRGEYGGLTAGRLALEARARSWRPKAPRKSKEAA